MRMNATSELLGDTEKLADRIRSRIGEEGLHDRVAGMGCPDLKNASAVLFLVTECRNAHGTEICVILNKRSAQIRQGGDLCCPGGGIAWRMDRILAKALQVPGSPLRRWSRRTRRDGNGILSLLLAAGLREAWEEMRLNPLRFEFLGMLPEQHLVMFDRVIYPLVGWASPQMLKPNWEVERIVHVPLRHLLDSDHYGRFRPMVAGAVGDEHSQPLRYDDFPCYIHQDEQGQEMLWGATYRITQSFLQLTFDFNPPQTDDLPLARRHLVENYLHGSKWESQTAYRDDETDW